MGGGALTRDRHGTCGGHYQEIDMANVGGGGGALTRDRHGTCGGH